MKTININTWNKKERTESLAKLFEGSEDLINLVHVIRVLHGRYEKTKNFYSLYNEGKDTTTIISYTHFGGDDDTDFANLKIEEFEGCEFVTGKQPIRSYFKHKEFTINIKLKEDFTNTLNKFGITDINYYISSVIKIKQHDK